MPTPKPPAAKPKQSRSNSAINSATNNVIVNGVEYEDYPNKPVKPEPKFCSECHTHHKPIGGTITFGMTCSCGQLLGSTHIQSVCVERVWKMTADNRKEIKDLWIKVTILALELAVGLILVWWR